jgi:hypothetical protein
MTTRIIVQTTSLTPRLSGTAALCYCAGLFDGEGWIGIHKQIKSEARRGYILRAGVTIVQNHLHTLQDFQILCGIAGRLYRVGRTQRSNRDSYALNYTGRDLERLLRVLRPFLLRKADECDVALEFIREGQIYRHFGPNGVPDHIWSTRERLARKIAKLK